MSEIPYNPGSAYPKKTTYVPPTIGHGINGPVNVTSVPMAPVRGSVAAVQSHLGQMHARAAAAAQVYHSAVPAAQAALSRRGVLDDAMSRQREMQGLRQNQTKARQVQRGNPVATGNKQAAEASMDAVVDKVIQSPSIGEAPRLIIPKWQNGKRSLD